MENKTINKGDFVKVAKDIGVVVFLENENNTPEDHIGIWYGEINTPGQPKYRTVPLEYATQIKDFERYH